MEVLSERNKTVLKAVVLNYIKDAMPISSGIIAEKCCSSLSSATIRNTMAELEDMGYLKKPHKSAGRMPTAKGFRFYVDCIMGYKELSCFEKERIKSRYNAMMDIKALMAETSNLLSSLSMCIGIVLIPRFDNVVIRHIELARVDLRHIMVAMVSDSGIIQTKVVEFDNDITLSMLSRISEYLNNISRGIRLCELRAKLINEMRQEKRLYDKLMKRIIGTSNSTMSGNIDDIGIYVHGRINIFNQPEFKVDAGRMKGIFQAFEDKRIILKLLNRTIEAKGVQIFIGSEDEYNEIKDLSLITASYGNGVYPMGTIGVMGPMRMDYSKIVPIVDYTARLLSERLTAKEVI